MIVVTPQMGFAREVAQPRHLQDQGQSSSQNVPEKFFDKPAATSARSCSCRQILH